MYISSYIYVILYRDVGLKRVLATIADEVDDSSDGKKWYAREMQEYSPEELQKTFSPEDVCLQESCNAGKVKIELI